MSETAKTRHIVAPYCTGNGVDLGSGGEPIVPWAIQFDLHRHYKHPLPPVQFVHSAVALPFRDAILDFVYASHILEDFPALEGFPDKHDWGSILSEWRRVIKPGGHIIIQVPDHKRYRAAVAAGQPDNFSHKHESKPGELTDFFYNYSGLRGIWEVIRDGFEPANDYNILFIAKRLS